MSSFDLRHSTFNSGIEKLRQQISLLCENYTSAKATIAALTIENKIQQQRIDQLTQQNQLLTEQYRDLRAGTANGASAEEIEALKARYVAMIREIDECIEKLNGR